MVSYNKAAEIRYAVRLRVVAVYLGILCMAMAAITMIPLIVSLIFGELNTSLRILSIMAVLFIPGFFFSRLKGTTNIQANEGMVIVVLTFLIYPVVMTYPLMSEGLGFTDTFFEAVSGITTTGLSTTGSLTGAHPAFLFTRTWMQWYGGLGIVVLSLALVMKPGIVAKSLAITESRSDDLVGGTKILMQRVLLIYSLLTLTGIVGAVITGMNFSDAVLYSMSAVSTGGFAPYQSSLAHFSLIQKIWILLFCIAGAVPLAYYKQMFSKKRYTSPGNFQIILLMAAMVIISALLGLSLKSINMKWTSILKNAPLMAVSAQTTAGFSTIPVSTLPPLSKLVLILAMITGGSIGSTSGGFKLIRLFILIGLVRYFIKRTGLPKHAVFYPGISGRRLRENDIQEALTLILLFIAVVFLSWLVFTAQGYDPLDSLFEVVSATGTVGLSSGITGPDLPASLKLILCADMFLGRLEIIAWMVLLYPGTWFGKKMEVS